jgi:hypothetical protein
MDSYSTTRWLHHSFRAGAVIDAIATVGMVFPGQLWTTRFRPPFNRKGPELAYGMRTGASLMAGWTVLLLWADRRPIERQDIVAITAVPVVAGLIANDVVAVRAGHITRSSVLPVRLLQSLLTLLFAFSYLNAKRHRVLSRWR